MNLSNITIYTYIYALLYSLLEIEIEGKDGWAKKLPTFTIKKGIFKNFTFYHILMNMIVILTNTFPIFNSIGINKKALFLSIYFNTLWFLVEDFLWFVFNPYYTIKKYNKNIDWHSNQKWLFGMPLHNYIGIMILLLMTYLTNEITLFKNLGFSLLATVIITYLSPIYHRFYLSCH